MDHVDHVDHGADEVNFEDDVLDDGDDSGDDGADDDGQAGAGDCVGAIQLVERECRGLVNSRDHLGRLDFDPAFDDHPDYDRDDDDDDQDDGDDDDDQDDDDDA